MVHLMVIDCEDKKRIGISLGRIRFISCTLPRANGIIVDVIYCMCSEILNGDLEVDIKRCACRYSCLIKTEKSHKISYSGRILGVSNLGISRWRCDLGYIALGRFFITELQSKCSRCITSVRNVILSVKFAFKQIWFKFCYLLTNSVSFGNFS